MRVQRLAKDTGSGEHGCHSVYVDEGGWFTVQGDLVDADILGNLENVLPGEGGVRLKPEVVIEAVRRYQTPG